MLNSLAIGPQRGLARLNIFVEYDPDITCGQSPLPFKEMMSSSITRQDYFAKRREVSMAMRFRVSETDIRR